MKLHTGWWKARDGSKWHVDYAGLSHACGHSEFGDVKCWDEFGETPEHDKNLISPWDEPKEGSAEWAKSLQVGTKIRRKDWGPGQFIARTSNGWSASKVGLNFNTIYDAGIEWEIYKEPKITPWNFGDVPVGAVLRTKGTGDPFRWMIVAVCSDGITTCGGTEVRTRSAKFLFETCEHSTDGGKTWLPCGVLKESK